MTRGGYSNGPLLKKTVREVGADRVTSLSASAAYNFFFSLFPLLLFLAPLLSLIGNKQAMVNFLMTQLTSVMPPDQLEAIRPVLQNIIFTKSAPGLLSVGLLLAAWSGSTVCGSLIGSLTTAYDVEETRSWIRQQAIRLDALRRQLVEPATQAFLRHHRDAGLAFAAGRDGEMQILHRREQLVLDRVGQGLQALRAAARLHRGLRQQHVLGRNQHLDRVGRRQHGGSWHARLRGGVTRTGSPQPAQAAVGGEAQQQAYGHCRNRCGKRPIVDEPAAGGEPRPPRRRRARSNA